MIDYIKGLIAECSPTYMVIENNGIGYMLNVSLTTHSQVQNAKSEVKLYVYESIREDAHVLYGFSEKRERDVFELLISVSGVGPNTARMILSSYPVDELEAAIASGNSSMLKSVKGVGAKTAQRIIVDLKDKINVVDVSLIDREPAASESFEEAKAALVMLGFTQQATQKTLKKLFASEPNLTVEQAIKKALKMM
ncbi:MAG: Holliday junction branch migration protein RuvA [Muribaculaceae bacterium]